MRLYGESLFCILLRFQEFSEHKRGCFWRITYFFKYWKIFEIKITFFSFNFLFRFSFNFWSISETRSPIVWVSKMITGLSLQKINVWNVGLIFSPKLSDIYFKEWEKLAFHYTILSVRMKGINTDTASMQTMTAIFSKFRHTVYFMGVGSRKCLAHMRISNTSQKTYTHHVSVVIFSNISQRCT